MNPFKIAILGNRNTEYGPHSRMHSSFEYFQKSFPFIFDWVPTEEIIPLEKEKNLNYNGFVAGSGPYLDKEGILAGIRFARKNNILFLGTCSGFNYAVLEFAQDIFALEKVYHPYEKPELPEYEIFLQNLNSCSREMHPIAFFPRKNSLTEKVYGQTKVVEMSHCTYGIHTEKIEAFRKKGFKDAGADLDGEIKIMEYSPNDFHIATLFLPQFTSSLDSPNPLMQSFLEYSQMHYGKARK